MGWRARCGNFSVDVLFAEVKYLNLNVHIFCLLRSEGPRTHAITEDGGLFIAGTTHKGLGGNHMSKVMQPENDHLRFYRVGTAAADCSAPACYTGAAEEFGGAAEESEKSARRMGLRTAADFGRGGNTHYLDTAHIVQSAQGRVESPRPLS